MLELARTVRFCLSADGSLATDAATSNTFAAWPPMRGLGRYYELEVVCRGEADPVTGYFMNIKVIDQAARQVALPMISGAVQGKISVGLGGLLRQLLAGLRPALHGSVASVCLRLTPTYSMMIQERDMNSVLISQQYEFAAAHRLHCASLSDAENKSIFGKCNNPAGHGHNYKVEVTVRAAIEPSGDTLAIERLDDVVEKSAISRLDHKHLNHDVPQFAAINSSVENIARVIYDMLSGELKSIGAELEEVKVWETSKTACTYRPPRK